MTGRITEVFSSVQGEGLYLGEPQVFVRFFGCNLSCKFCDTRLDRFTEYQPQELFEEIKLYSNGFHSISFTGGEPLLQKDFLKEILKLTRQAGYRNYLETNGTLSGELSEVINLLDIVAMDLKLASSAGMGNLWNLHRKFLRIASQKEVFLKTVICQSTQDGDLKEALGLVREVNRAAVVILQPNSYEDYNGLKEKLESFKNICAQNQITACIIPQIHKLVGIR